MLYVIYVHVNAYGGMQNFTYSLKRPFEAFVVVVNQ